MSTTALMADIEVVSLFSRSGNDNLTSCHLFLFWRLREVSVGSVAKCKHSLAKPTPSGWLPPISPIFANILDFGWLSLPYQMIYGHCPTKGAVFNQQNYVSKICNLWPKASISGFSMM